MATQEQQDWVGGLTVAKLKDELKSRGLGVSGLKVALQERLLEALASEKSGGENQEVGVPACAHASACVHVGSVHVAAVLRACVRAYMHARVRTRLHARSRMRMHPAHAHPPTHHLRTHACPTHAHAIAWAA